MSEGRSEDFQKHFCGTHFFNPARYLKLFEIIPATSQEVLDFLTIRREILEKQLLLLKTLLLSLETCWNFGIQSLFHLVKEMGSIEEVDKLTGPVIGRPSQLLLEQLMFGLDTLVHVANGIYENCQTTNDMNYSNYQISSIK
jgi:3-hydroxyacyl-CoA dehydrogenase